MAVEQAAAAEVAAQDADQRAKVAELEKAAELALASGNLPEAGGKIAELERGGGDGGSVARLRKAYEALAGERETNKRYADASLAHDRAMKFDPGQTLQAKQDELERKWREAEAARQGRSWGQALSAYDAVIAQSAELVKLDASRQDAKTRRKTAEEAKQSSEESKADTYAKDLDAEGGRAASRAAESFEKGDFAGAAKFWGEAAAEYAKARSRSVAVQAYDKAKTAYETAAASDLALLKAHGGKLWNEVNRQARLGEASVNDPATGAEAYRKAASGLPAAVAEARAAEKAARLATALAEARAAKVREDWPAVVAAADKALAIDDGNVEATHLKAEAEGKLTPTLTILAQTEDGRDVSAVVGDGQNTWKTSQAIPLKAGASYSFTISIPSIPSTRCAPATLPLTVDWRGPQTRRVTLKEITGPAQGEPWTVPDLGLVLMPVAAGSFQMGSDGGKNDEKPVRTVRITRDFWMGKTEVTQAEYRKVTGKAPSKFKGDDLPVEQVSRDDAVAFCDELTRRERAAGRIPQGYAYRLPTEAEWEYAAKGGAKSKGCTYAGGNDIDAVAWYYRNAGRNRLDASSDWDPRVFETNEICTHSVGQKPANELGLYDMSGNVSEWCQDSYAAYPVSNESDPKRPGVGWPVIRGGSWSDRASVCHVASRNFIFNVPSNVHNDNLGFRVVLAPVP